MSENSVTADMAGHVFSHEKTTIERSVHHYGNAYPYVPKSEFTWASADKSELMYRNQKWLRAVSVIQKARPSLSDDRAKTLAREFCGSAAGLNISNRFSHTGRPSVFVRESDVDKLIEFIGGKEAPVIAPAPSVSIGHPAVNKYLVLLTEETAKAFGMGLVEGIADKVLERIAIKLRT